MDDIFMNARNDEEVVQPQEGEQNTEQEVVPPEDMSDADFMKHIEGLKNGTITPRENIKPQNEAVNTSEQETAMTAKEPFKTFDTEEDFQGFMNKAIGDRLKSSRAEKERYEEYGRRAMNFYGGENYEDAISKMLDDVEAQFAESSGKTKEEFEEDMRLKMDAMKYRSQIAEVEEREKAISALCNEWAKEEEALKRAVPGFELSKAMENDEFKNLVVNEGMSLSSAYIILSQKQSKPQRQVVHEVGNTKGNAAGVGTKRPEEMSKEEFDAYIERIRKNGG